MQVNVFIARNGESRQTLLVMPYGPVAAIPDHLQHQNWRSLATTTSDDVLLQGNHDTICEELRRYGFALLQQSGRVDASAELARLLKHELR